MSVNNDQNAGVEQEQKPSGRNFEAWDAVDRIDPNIRKAAQKILESITGENGALEKWVEAFLANSPSEPDCWEAIEENKNQARKAARKVVKEFSLAKTARLNLLMKIERLFDFNLKSELVGGKRDGYVQIYQLGAALKIAYDKEEEEAKKHNITANQGNIKVSFPQSYEMALEYTGAQNTIGGLIKQLGLPECYLKPLLPPVVPVFEEMVKAQSLLDAQIKSGKKDEKKYSPTGMWADKKATVTDPEQEPTMTEDNGGTSEAEDYNSDAESDISMESDSDTEPAPAPAPAPTPEPFIKLEPDINQLHQSPLFVPGQSPIPTTETFVPGQSQTPNPDFFSRMRPWVTLDLEDGRIIIAGRQHTRLGVKTGTSDVIVLDGRIHKIIPGTAVGEAAISRFFSTPGIKLMSERNPDGSKIKNWSARDRVDYGGMLWCAQSEPTGRTKAVETQCAVLMKSEVELMTRTDHKAVASSKRGDKTIEAYCIDLGTPTPWDSLITKPKLEPGLGTKHVAKESGLDDSRMTALEAKFDTKMATLDAKFDTKMASLDSQLAQLTMAATETQATMKELLAGIAGQKALVDSLLKLVASKN